MADDAEPGDVIKSHTEFAYFTKTGNTGRWRGNLQYMKPGEGYMMLRKGAGNASFTYPYYELGSNFRGTVTLSASSLTPMVIYGRSTGESLTLKYYDVAKGVLYTIPDAVKM